jgi:hypothetical protein
MKSSSTLKDRALELVEPWAVHRFRSSRALTGGRQGAAGSDQIYNNMKFNYHFQEEPLA